MINENKRELFVNLAKEVRDYSISDSERMETSDEAEPRITQSNHETNSWIQRLPAKALAADCEADWRPGIQ